VDAEAIAAVSTAVVALTSLVKWGGVPDKYGPLLVLAIAAIGCGMWGYSREAMVSRPQLFSYFAAWIVVATSAAGVFGFTRATGAAVHKAMSPPSGGAGQNPTEKP
jgi:hypothetical protein